MTMSTLKRCVLAAMAVASMAVMLTGCSGSSGESSDTIKIGANLELTGNSASYGTSAKNGIEMAVKEINDAGGLLGKKIEVSYADNRSEATEAYLQKDTDFKAALTKIKAANPDVIYVPGYYQEVGMIIKQAREMGMTQPIVGGDGWDSTKLAEIAGAANLVDCYFSNHYSSDDTSEVVQNFVSNYQKAYGQKPDAPAAVAYDSMMILAQAIKDANSTDKDTVKAALEKISGFNAVSGKISFNEFHDPVKSAVVLSFKDGKQIFVTKVEP